MTDITVTEPERSSLAGVLALVIGLGIALILMVNACVGIAAFFHRVVFPHTIVVESYSILPVNSVSPTRPQYDVVALLQSVHPNDLVAKHVRVTAILSHGVGSQFVSVVVPTIDAAQTVGILIPIDRRVARVRMRVTVRTWVTQPVRAAPLPPVTCSLASGAIDCHVDNSSREAVKGLSLFAGVFNRSGVLLGAGEAHSLTFPPQSRATVTIPIGYGVVPSGSHVTIFEELS